MQVPIRPEIIDPGGETSDTASIEWETGKWESEGNERAFLVAQL